jgi:hypothetical protein
VNPRDIAHELCRGDGIRECPVWQGKEQHWGACDGAERAVRTGMIKALRWASMIVSSSRVHQQATLEKFQAKLAGLEKP